MRNLKDFKLGRHWVKSPVYRLRVYEKKQYVFSFHWGRQALSLDLSRFLSPVVSGTYPRIFFVVVPRRKIWGNGKRGRWAKGMKVKDGKREIVRHRKVNKGTTHFSRSRFLPRAGKMRNTALRCIYFQPSEFVMRTIKGFEALLSNTNFSAFPIYAQRKNTYIKLLYTYVYF